MPWAPISLRRSAPAGSVALAAKLPVGAAAPAGAGVVAPAGAGAAPAGAGAAPAGAGGGVVAAALATAAALAAASLRARAIALMRLLLSRSFWAPSMPSSFPMDLATASALYPGPMRLTPRASIMRSAERSVEVRDASSLPEAALAISASFLLRLEVWSRSSSSRKPVPYPWLRRTARFALRRLEGVLQPALLHDPVDHVVVQADGLIRNLGPDPFVLDGAQGGGGALTARLAPVSPAPTAAPAPDAFATPEATSKRRRWPGPCP